MESVIREYKMCMCVRGREKKRKVERQRDLVRSKKWKRVRVCVCVCVCVCARARAQLCPTLCNPMDHSLPGSSVHGIIPARMLEWVAIFSSRGSSQRRDWTCISCIAGRIFFTNEPPGKPIYYVYYIHIPIIQPSDSAKGKDLYLMTWISMKAVSLKEGKY